MGFWNKERKIYAGIVLAGALGYIAYRKYGSPVKVSTPATGAQTNFTGAAYYSADGGHDCGCGCGGDCGRTCEQLATELATVRQHITNSHMLTTDHVAMLHHRESELVSKMTAKGCA
jgi:hypothetical protein